MYFDKPGKDNTDLTLKLAAERGRELGMEEVVVQGFELPGAALFYLDEVIHEDICGADWLLRRLVRRRWGFQG